MCLKGSSLRDKAAAHEVAHSDDARVFGGHEPSHVQVQLHVVEVNFAQLQRKPAERRNVKGGVGV
jgi:hypothetical protein